MTKSNSERKGFILSDTSSLKSITKEVRAGNWKQNVKQEPLRNAASLAVTCSAYFLLLPRTTCLGVATPTVGWAFPHPSI